MGYRYDVDDLIYSLENEDDPDCRYRFVGEDEDVGIGFPSEEEVKRAMYDISYREEFESKYFPSKLPLCKINRCFDEDERDY